MVRVERSNSDLAASARAQAGPGSSMQVDGAVADDDSDEEDYDEESASLASASPPSVDPLTPSRSLALRRASN